ncbi:MAG: hypothetical protein FVQ81_11545 [Candidatus Glassbacteria bacterium]|nr:hypothetical protein [Candidatus Glassbacteria bacterium]
MDAIAIFTLVVAFLGLGLGIINTVWTLARDRARLHISVRYEPPKENWTPQDHHLFINIGNSSLFALTLSYIYFENCLGNKKTKVNFFKDETIDWPTFLAQGSAISFHLSRSYLKHPDEISDPEISWWKSNLVIETATGNKFYIRGKAVRDFLRSTPVKKSA